MTLPPWSESVDPATGPGYQIDMFICLYVDVISMMPCLFSVCVIQAHSRQRAWTRCQHRNGAKWWQPNVSPSCRIFGKKMWKIGQMVRAWIVYTVLHVKSRMYLLLLFRLRLRCYFCLYVFRDSCIALLKLLPSSGNYLVKSCARCQGTVTELNELHEKVT